MRITTFINNVPSNQSTVLQSLHNVGNVQSLKTTLLSEHMNKEMHKRNLYFFLSAALRKGFPF